MFPPRHANSRYLGKARAAHLARLVAAGAIVVVPAACGGGDAEVFGTATTDAAPTAPATSPASTPATTTGPAATMAPATDAPAASAGATFPAGGELVVDFTFAAESSDGRVRNPYVAVWVEDGDGNYVATIAVWYEQSDKGTRWIGDLRAWMGASNGEVSSTSTGATRAPGSYSVTWDGTDLDGNLVSQGDYVLFVEAAREHGPYEITSAPLTIGGTGFTVTLDDNGELSDLSATLTA